MLIKKAKDEIVHAGYVKNLLLANADYFTMLLGPDVDVQSGIYLLGPNAGYDFSKNFGLRLGYSFDYLHYQNAGNSTFAEPLLGAVYLQAVLGF